MIRLYYDLMFALSLALIGLAIASIGIPNTPENA